MDAKQEAAQAQQIQVDKEGYERMVNAPVTEQHLAWLIEQTRLGLEPLAQKKTDPEWIVFGLSPTGRDDLDPKLAMHIAMPVPEETSVVAQVTEIMAEKFGIASFAVGCHMMALEKRPGETKEETMRRIAEITKEAREAESLGEIDGSVEGFVHHIRLRGGRTIVIGYVIDEHGHLVEENRADSQAGQDIGGNMVAPRPTLH